MRLLEMPAISRASWRMRGFLDRSVITDKCVNETNSVSICTIIHLGLFGSSIEVDLGKKA